MKSRLDLAREGDAILRRARFDAFTGMRKNRDFRRNKKAEGKILHRLRREKEAKLGKPASPVRMIVSE